MLFSIVGADYAILASKVTYSIESDSVPTSVKWYKNDREVVQYPGEDMMTLKLYDVGYPAAGVFYAVAVFNGEEYKSNEITLEIGETERKVECFVKSRKVIEANVGDEISLAPYCHTVPSSANRSSVWIHNGEQISEDEYISFEIESPSDFGLYELQTQAWAYGSYEPYEGKTLLEIKQSSENLCPFIYIHDLNPARNAGFIRIGWWVYDEILKAVDDGFKWEDDPFNERFKYNCELSRLAWGFKNYPNLEVQESRNGYIYGREKLLNG